MGNSSLMFLNEQVQSLKTQSLFMTYRSLQSAQVPHSLVDGKVVINLASNNYLGLTTHPRLKKAAIEAIKTFGVGIAAGRTICGNLALHDELERKVARFKGLEAALTFQTGYDTNAGFIPAIMGEEDAIVSDELNHASIIDGCRMSRARVKRYKHADPESAEQALREAHSEGARRVLIVTDGVFSMDGDIAPLPELIEVSKRHEAILMVDDAHAVGVLGKNGRGTASHFGVEGEVDIVVGTFSKALGVMGGYLAGPQVLIEWLKNRHRPSVFSSSTQTPAALAASAAAIDVLQEEPERIERLWIRTTYFRQSLAGLGFNVGRSQTPIIPVITGHSETATQLSQKLFERGVFASAIVYPIVANDQARLRLLVSSEHTTEDLDEALAALEKVGRELGLIQ
jgi:glycine C-acetyltransferase